MTQALSSGTIQHGKHFLPMRVYYDVTDSGGVVYYANYLIFAERARTEFLRSVGIEQQKLSDVEHCVFVVRRVQIDYRASAKLDDLLMIETEIIKIRGARLELIQHIKRDEETLVVCDVEIAFIHRDGRPRKIPADLLEKLNTA